MAKLKKLAGQQPLLFMLLMILLMLVVGAIFVGLAIGLLGGAISDNGVQAAGQLGAFFVFVLLIWRWGWLRSTGVSRLGGWRVWLVTVVALVYLLPLTMYAFFGTVRYALPDSPELPAVALSSFSAGLLEELVFRGLILYVLATAWGPSRRGRALAVIVASISWAALHLLNAGRGDAQEAWLQIANTAISGIWYGALVLEWGTIWPVVLIHGLVNVAISTFALGVPDIESRLVQGYLLTTLVELPWLFFGLYLLRRTRRERLPEQSVAEASLAR